MEVFPLLIDHQRNFGIEGKESYIHCFSPNMKHYIDPAIVWKILLEKWLRFCKCPQESQIQTI